MTTGIQTAWATVDQIADLKAEYKLLHQQQLQHQQQKQEIIQEQLRQQQPEMIRMIVSQQASQPQKMTATSSATLVTGSLHPGAALRTRGSCASNRNKLNSKHATWLNEPTG